MEIDPKSFVWSVLGTGIKISYLDPKGQVEPEGNDHGKEASDKLTDMVQVHSRNRVQKS